MADFKKKLQEEVAALEYELRNELPKEILKARAHGDLSENAEYHAAKERQGFVNARLHQLKRRLAEMSMIDYTKIPHDRVGLGSTVIVLDTKRDDEITYNLVTPEEAQAGSGAQLRVRFRGGGIVTVGAGLFEMVHGRVAGGVDQLTRFGGFFGWVIDRYSDLAIFMVVLVEYASINRFFCIVRTAIGM